MSASDFAPLRELDDDLCECGHDHYTEMSPDREMWTTECRQCACKQFRQRTLSTPPTEQDDGN